MGNILNYAHTPPEPTPDRPFHEAVWRRCVASDMTAQQFIERGRRLANDAHAPVIRIVEVMVREHYHGDPHDAVARVIREGLFSYLLVAYERGEWVWKDAPL